MDSINDVFKKNLQYYMDLKGISRTDLCKALDYNYSTVSEWLQGSKVPRMNKVAQIASYLNIDISNLVYEHKLMTKNDFELANVLEKIGDISLDLNDDDKSMLINSLKQTLEMFERIK